MQRAVRKVMNRGLSDAPLHIVFALFDQNKDNNLAASELLTVSLCCIDRQTNAPLSCIEHFRLVLKTRTSCCS